MFCRATIRLGISPHSSYYYFFIFIIIISFAALARCGVPLQTEQRGLSVCLSVMIAIDVDSGGSK